MFGLWGLLFGDEDLGVGKRGFGVWGLGFGMTGVELRLRCLEFGVWGVGDESRPVSAFGAWCLGRIAGGQMVLLIN